MINTVRSPISTVAVLPSSLPEYHRAYMKGHPKHGTSDSDYASESAPGEQSHAQKAATARRLKPHSRPLGPDRLKPEPLTQIPQKKAKPTKWQFGIRSRNQPAEAMLAIYKALQAMGAEWEVPTTRKAGGRSSSRSSGRSAHSKSRSVSRSRRSRSHESSFSTDSSDEYARSDHSFSSDRRGPLSVRNSSSEAHGSRSRGRQRRHYSIHNDWGYSIPEDPWVINARFRKDGMYPPGVAHPSSTHSSRTDLHHHAAAALRGRSNTNTSLSSMGHSEQFQHPESAGDDRYASPDDAAYVYMSIQLYSIERDFYVVDFRCAGYERVVAHLVREIKTHSAAETQLGNLHITNPDTDQEHVDGEWIRLGEGDPVPSHGVLNEWIEERGVGRVQGDKRATSPFPFLDVASTLILQLSGE